MLLLVLAATLAAAQSDVKAAPLPHPSWPISIVEPDGMRPYTPMHLSQHVVIRDGRPHHEWFANDRDDVTLNSFAANPNKIFPWRVSGGLDNIAGWKSVKLTNIRANQVKVWTESIPIAGAGQSLPAKRWSFPDGTVFADLLVNAKGEAFELRTRTKTDGKWRNQIEYENTKAAPAGYNGAGFRCVNCHDHAGSSRQYGLLVRGSDTVFSFNPFLKE